MKTTKKKHVPVADVFLKMNSHNYNEKENSKSRNLASKHRYGQQVKGNLVKMYVNPITHQISFFIIKNIPLNVMTLLVTTIREDFDNISNKMDRINTLNIDTKQYEKSNFKMWGDSADWRKDTYFNSYNKKVAISVWEFFCFQ